MKYIEEAHSKYPGDMESAIKDPKYTRTGPLYEDMLKALIEFSKRGFFNTTVMPHQQPSFDSTHLWMGPQTRLIRAGTTLDIFLANLRAREFLRITELNWEFCDLLARNDLRFILKVGRKFAMRSGREEPDGRDTMPGITPTNYASSPINEIISSTLSQAKAANDWNGLRAYPGVPFNATTDTSLFSSDRDWSVEHSCKGMVNIFVRADESDKEVTLEIQNASTHFNHSVTITINGWIHHTFKGRPDGQLRLINPESI